MDAKTLVAKMRKGLVPFADYRQAADMLEQQAAQIADLIADRDSWRDQASQRVKDWDDMRQERDKALARIKELEAAQLPDEPTATMIAAMLGWREIDLGDVPYTKGDGDIRMVWAMYEALRRNLKGARDGQA